MAQKGWDVFEFLIYGFIREYEKRNKLSNTIPNELKKLMKIFYPGSEFKFIDDAIKSGCEIENDGKTLIFDKRKWVTCQIGDFFDSKQKFIHKIALRHCGEDICGWAGIGFITKNYTQFIADAWKSRKNESIMIYSNAFYTTSQSVVRDLKDRYRPNHLLWSSLETYWGWYKSDDIIMIKIDTNKMKAIIWNSTPPKEKIKKGIIDLDVDKEYKDFKNWYFKMNLPKDVSVALIVELGKKQTVEIIQHETQYSKYI